MTTNNSLSTTLSVFDSDSGLKPEEGALVGIRCWLANRSGECRVVTNYWEDHSRVTPSGNQSFEIESTVSGISYGTFDASQPWWLFAYNAIMETGSMKSRFDDLAGNYRCLYYIQLQTEISNPYVPVMIQDHAIVGVGERVWMTKDELCSA